MDSIRHSKAARLCSVTDICGLVKAQRPQKAYYCCCFAMLNVSHSSVCARLQARRVCRPQQMQVFPRIRWKDV